MCAAAYNWFAASAVDVNVIEVGMGGKWDATNVIDAEVAVITNIGPTRWRSSDPPSLTLPKKNQASSPLNHMSSTAKHLNS